MDSTEDQIQDLLNFTNSAAGPAHRPGLFIRMFQVGHDGLLIPLNSHRFPSGLKRRPDEASKRLRPRSMVAGVEVRIITAAFLAFLTNHAGLIDGLTRQNSYRLLSNPTAKFPTYYPLIQPRCFVHTYITSAIKNNCPMRRKLQLLSD